MLMDAYAEASKSYGLYREITGVIEGMRSAGQRHSPDRPPRAMRASSDGCSAARHAAGSRPSSAADDVRAAHQRHHLVKGVHPAHALPAEAAIAAEDQPLRRDEPERLADEPRDLLWVSTSRLR